MPRIRSLKPEHKQHRKIGPLTDRQYRLWVGMLTEADDEGRLVADTAQLRLQVFGYHPRVRPEHVCDALRTLHDAHLIELYTVEGIQYAAFPSWRDHQYIQKRQTSKLPPPLHYDNGTVPLPADANTTIVGSEGIKDQGRDQGVEAGDGVDNSRQRPHGSTTDALSSTRKPSKAEILAALAQRNGLTPEELHDQATAIARASVRRA